MHANVTISSDRNAVYDTCLTTFQIVDRSLPEMRQGGQLRRPHHAQFLQLGWLAGDGAHPRTAAAAAGTAS